MPTTTYTASVEFRLKDRASRGANKSRAAVDRLSKSVGSLRRLAIATGVALATGFVARAGFNALVKYNSTLEDAKNNMAGLLQLNQGGDFNSNLERSTQLMEKFKIDAKKSAGTLEDFAIFSSKIIGPASRAGLGDEDLRRLTQGGVVASQAFGIDSSQAALDIEQALIGTLTKKDRFARALIEPFLKSKGVTKDFTTAWNKMVSGAPEKAAKLLADAFEQPGVKSLAKAFESSFTGVLSTFKDNLQQFFGTVGTPIFKAITAQLIKWNKWLGKNKSTVDAMAAKLSKFVKGGFEAIVNSVKFIAKHKNTLLAIASAFAAIKIGGGIAALGSGFGKTMSGATSKLGLFAAALGVGITSINALFDHLNGKIDEDQGRIIKDVFGIQNFIESKGKFGPASGIGAFTEQFKTGPQTGENAATTATRKMTAALGILGSLKTTIGKDAFSLGKSEQTGLPQIKLNEELLLEKFKQAGTPQRLAEKYIGWWNEALAATTESAKLPDFLRNMLNIKDQTTKEEKANGSGLKDNLNINISKIEVKSEDPDMFAFGLSNLAKDLLKNPQAPRTLIPEG